MTRTPQDIDRVVGERAAAVEALVDDDRVLVRLGIEVALEGFVACAGGIRHVHVRHAAAGGRIDFADVPLDPGAVPERRLVRDGTTCTVREPLPSGFGPTVMSTARSTVFSNGA